VEIDVETQVSSPFSLKEWTEGKREELKKGPVFLFNKGEFKISILGETEAKEEKWNGEIWLHQLSGQREITIEKETITLKKDHVTLIQPNKPVHYHKSTEETRTFIVKMDPLANKKKIEKKKKTN